MTFIDLAHAERAAEMIALYYDEFPGHGSPGAGVLNG